MVLFGLRQIHTMHVFSRLLLLFVLAAVNLPAATPPDESRLKELLAVSDKIVFFAGFGEVLDALDAGSVGAFHATLVEKIEKGLLSRRYRDDAIELTELCWARLEPKGFMEACSARKRSYSLDAQQEALAALLRTDRDAAMRLYLQAPLYGDIWRCRQFFRDFAEVDAVRAVKFYFESPECEKTFNVPLEGCFETWARHDMDAAWAAAENISDNNFRQPARRSVLLQTAKDGVDKFFKLLGKIPDSKEKNESVSHMLSHLIGNNQRKRAVEIATRLDSTEVWTGAVMSMTMMNKPEQVVPKLIEIFPETHRAACLAHYFSAKFFRNLPAEQIEQLYAAIPDEKLRSEIRSIIASKASGGNPANAPAPIDAAPDDATLEKLLAAGPGAYLSNADGDGRAVLVKAMFRRFPERSFAWLSRMQESSRDYLTRELAAAWPAAKIPADTVRFLEGPGLLEKSFGVELGHLWLRNDPVAAIPVLFSSDAGLAGKFRGGEIFYDLQERRKLDRVKIEALLDSIKEPKGRELARRDFAIFSIPRMPPAEALKSILALPDKGDRRKAAEGFVSNGVEAFESVLFEMIKGIGPEHTETRDMLLEILAGKMRNYSAKAGRLPEMIAAIHDEGVRLRVMRQSSGYQTDREGLVESLASMTPGGERDELIANYVNYMPPRDALAFAKKTQSMVVRARLLARLARLANGELSDGEIAECRKLLESLPAAHRDKQIEFFSITDFAQKDAGELLAEIASRGMGNSDSANSAGRIFAAWIKKDPRAALDAILATGPSRYFTQYLDGCIMAVANNDLAAAFSIALSLPVHTSDVTSEIISRWASADPQAACSACLRIDRKQMRVPALRSCLMRWASKNSQAATAWVMGMPSGPDRFHATIALASQIQQSQRRLGEELFLEAILGHPDCSVNEQYNSSGGLKEAADKRLKELEESRAAVRSKAGSDLDAASAFVRDAPDGLAKDFARLGLLDYALSKKKDALIQSLTSEMLTPDKPHLVQAVVKTMIESFEQEHPEKAAEFAAGIAQSDARFAATAAIVSRWATTSYRPMVEKLIREYPDPSRRHALAGRLFIELPMAERLEPDVLKIYLEIVLKRADLIAARADIARGLLDKRPMDAESALPAMPDEDSRRRLEEWIQERKNAPKK